MSLKNGYLSCNSAKTYAPNPCFCLELLCLEHVELKIHMTHLIDYVHMDTCEVMNSVNSKVMESLLWEYDIPHECHVLVDKYKIIHMTFF